MIETLPLLIPDNRHSARTLARCHERLARRRKRLRSAEKPASTKYLAVERALVIAFCVIYMSGVVLIAFQMLGIG
jgi:hypothetical protein